MKVQQLKKVKKNFEEVYKESETKEINIKINGYEIFITEQQAGLIPHLERLSKKVRPARGT
ncbi:MAG TPA: hypothetical protein PLR50_11105 [Candidatus Rifleibacterium sp.]|nr:hypothetical protein [Candidatus Rifleibacterium sp.]